MTTTMDCAGTWRAIGSASTRGEVAFIGDEPDPNGVHDWLNGDGHMLAGEVQAVDGLVLHIDPSGGFTEQKHGNPPICWFDSEGVQTSEVEPFNGVLSIHADAAYLLSASVQNWAKAVEGRYGPAVLRYDDGDTKICDRIERVGNELLRTINVVTDELYLDRVLIVYR